MYTILDSQTVCVVCSLNLFTFACSCVNCASVYNQKLNCNIHKNTQWNNKLLAIVETHRIPLKAIDNAQVAGNRCATNVT